MLIVDPLLASTSNKALVNKSGSVDFMFFFIESKFLMKL